MTETREVAHEVRHIEPERSCADRLTELLVSKGLTISCAESATCGLVAKLLTDRAGSSAWYWGGVETYSNEAKNRLLGVPADLLADPSEGPVSHRCAALMADGMRRISGTDIAVSVTGIAGPTGEEPGKPVGTVYIGISSNFRKTETIRLHVPSQDRDGCRRTFASACLSLAFSYTQGDAIVDIARCWV